MIVLTALANQFRLHKLDKVEKFVMSYGGLRGAVAFALVLLIDRKHVPLQPMFVTTTIAVIYFTVFIQVGSWSHDDCMTMQSYDDDCMTMQCTIVIDP